MSGVAQARLAQERKNWRKDHPFGFVARPETRPDGSVDMFTWKCLIPGKAGTDWEGGQYPLTLKFTEDYPTKPPACHLPAGFFHPNVFDSGAICLSILKEGTGWKPSLSVKQIVEGVQRLLLEPNNNDAAQDLAYGIYKYERTKYRSLVRQQAKKYNKPPS